MKNYHEQMLAAFGDAEDDRILADKLGAISDAYRRKLSRAGICLCGILAAEHASLPEPVADALKDYFVACRNWLASAFDGRKRAGTAWAGLSKLSARRIACGSRNGDPTLFNRVVEEAIRAQEQAGVRRRATKRRHG